MRNRFFVLAAVLMAAVAVHADISSITPVPQGGSDTNNWWWKRFREKQQIVTGGGSEVVFIGDSITHGWEGSGRAQWAKYFASEPYKALNLGYSGARTEHILWNIANGQLDGYKAKAIVLMIGTNNTGHNPFEKEPPADTIIGIKAVIDAIRAKQPQARVVLLPIFPRGATVKDPYRRRNEVVNKEIRKFADGKNVLWCDFNAQYLTPDGFMPAEIMPDRLHPGAYGYEIWASAVLPFIKGILAGDAFIPQRFAPFADTTTLMSERGDATIYPATRIMEEHPHRGQNWWLNRLREKRNQIVASNGEIDIVFFGDSITHFWENRSGEIYGELCKRYSILNIGYGGDRTQHLVWRGENGELDGYKTKCVMLMIGTNNVHNDQPADVARGIRKVLDVIAAKQPQATTLLLPIFPRGATAKDGLRVKNEKVNAIIRGYADGKKVVWCDFNAKFLDENGNLPKTIMPDLLHPNREGYIIWRDAVLPQFQTICGK